MGSVAVTAEDDGMTYPHTDGCAGHCGTNDSDNPPCPGADRVRVTERWRALDLLSLVSKGPGDCTCGLYALLEAILCTCGHTVRHHTNRDVSDVVGWPCFDCKSARCTGFTLAVEVSA